MAALVVTNLVVNQGATFRKLWDWQDEYGTPVDLTGCTAVMDIRPGPGDPELYATLTTENGGIVLAVEGQNVEVVISDEISDSFFWLTGRYDLKILHPNGEVTRFAEGTVQASPRVTV